MRRISDAALAAQIATIAYISGAFERLRRNERGQGTIEYVGVVIVAVLLVGAVLAVIKEDAFGIGTKLQGMIDKILSRVPGGGGGGGGGVLPPGPN